MSRHRSSFADGFRELLLRGGAGGGMIPGLLWGMEQPPPAPKPCATEAGVCFGDLLTATFMPYLMGGGVGFGLGAAIAFALVVLLRPARPCAGAPVGAHPQAGAREKIARYSGSCGRCGGSVAPGDRIVHAPGRLLCERCGLAASESPVEASSRPPDLPIPRSCRP